MEKLLTILIPALNEEQTIGICIQKAKEFIEKNNINGEILVANNNSTDNTEKVSKDMGARVITVKNKGYGNALIEGTKNAYGKYTIMGDADNSYNFLELEELVKKLEEGYDLVIGNRYGKRMEKGAMPILHKYIGTPILSLIMRMKHKVKFKDINCGLRGYNTKKVIALNCEAEGMEYASEMIIKAKKANLKMEEIPIKYYKDSRKRKPHLSTIRDGIRHIKIILH